MRKYCRWREKCVFAFLPFLKICILSLDSSTLPSSSMTPGKVRRVPGTAGKLTAATLLWKPTWDRCRYPSAAACETSISVCGTDPRTGEEELLWRAAATRPCAQTNCHPSRDRCVPSPLRPVTENNRKWFLLTGIIRPTQQKTLMRTFSSSANSHSTIKESCDSTLRSESGPHSR